MIDLDILYSINGLNTFRINMLINSRAKFTCICLTIIKIVTIISQSHCIIWQLEK